MQSFYPETSESIRDCAQCPCLPISILGLGHLLSIFVHPVPPSLRPPAPPLMCRVMPSRLAPTRFSPTCLPPPRRLLAVAPGAAVAVAAGGGRGALERSECRNVLDGEGPAAGRRGSQALLPCRGGAGDGGGDGSADRGEISSQFRDGGAATGGVELARLGEAAGWGAEDLEQ